VGPEGVEPSPGRLKVCCAAVTPRPREAVVERFQTKRATHFFRLKMSLRSIRVEIARGGVEPPLSPYRSDVLPLHHQAFFGSFVSLAIETPLTFRSGWSESNRLVRVPETRRRPVLSSRFISSSYGNRTHLSALKGQDPKTDRRTSRLLVESIEVGREALESSSPGFQPGAKPSQLPTPICRKNVLLIPNETNKKARSCCDFGP
jgi:hypothetical protein